MAKNSFLAEAAFKICSIRAKLYFQPTVNVTKNSILYAARVLDRSRKKLPG